MRIQAARPREIMLRISTRKQKKGRLRVVIIEQEHTSTCDGMRVKTREEGMTGNECTRLMAHKLPQPLSSKQRGLRISHHIKLLSKEIWTRSLAEQTGVKLGMVAVICYTYKVCL